MNTVETVVAEAWNAGRYEWQPEFGGTADEWAARAAVAALAGMGPVTDDEIVIAVRTAVDSAPAAKLAIPAVRELLARQAAVHATRIAELEADIHTGETAMRIVQAESVVNNRRAEAAEAEVTALRATVERVRALCESDAVGNSANSGAPAGPWVFVRDVRAALDGAS